MFFLKAKLVLCAEMFNFMLNRIMLLNDKSFDYVAKVDIQIENRLPFLQQVSGDGLR